MSIILNDNIYIKGGKPSESKYLNDDNNVYNTIAEANLRIPISERHDGLTVNILNDEYWYRNGKEDGNLIKKINSSFTDVSNGLNILNENVKLGGTLIESTIINTDNHTLNIVGDFNIGSQPARYNSDYSLSYTDRSIPDVGYVLAVAQGLDPKEAVNVATTTIDGNIDLTGGTFGGTIDDISIQNGNRILIKNQTNKIENGIYDYISSGNTFERSYDLDGLPSGETKNNAYTVVLTGITNINSSWILKTEVNPIIGVTDLEFILYALPLGISSSDGININVIGSTKEISVKLGSTNVGVEFDGSGGLVAKVNDGLNVDENGINIGGILSTGRTLNLNSNTLAFTCGDILVSDNPIKYNTDLSSSYTNRSIPDVEFVTGQTNNVLDLIALRVVCESTNRGYRRDNGIAENYGNIGNDAVDFSISNSVSTTRGSIGENSFTIGLNNINNGLGSFVGGNNNCATTDYSYTIGSNNCMYGNFGYVNGDCNIVRGDYSIANGQFNEVCGLKSNIGGSSSKIYGNCSFGYGMGLEISGNTQFIGGSYNLNKLDNIFEIGIGNDNLNRCNGFEVSSDGTTTIEKDLIINTQPPSGSTSNILLVWDNTDKKVKSIESNFTEYKHTNISNNITLTDIDEVVFVTGGSNVVVTLQSTPTDRINKRIKDKTGNAYLNPIVINGNGNNIDGDSIATINSDYGSIELVFENDEWSVMSFVG